MRAADDGTGGLNLRLLERLVAAHGQAVSRDRLCREAGVGERALAAEIDRLGAAGYVVHAVHPHGSTAYRLAEVPDRLYAHEIRRRLTTVVLGVEIVSLETCGSTNDEARALVRRGAPGGTLVVAEEQTTGRGRAGRRWHSPRGPGLYFSLVLRPEAALRSPALLQAATAVGVAHGLMALTGRPADLRWPNDVLMRGRKVAGILVESVETAGPPALVAGIGLNVNHAREDFPVALAADATSLRMEAGRRFPRAAVLATVLGSLEEWFERLRRGEATAIEEAWRPLCALLGREVWLLRGARQEVRGTVLALSPAEGIRLRLPDGSESSIPAGHVAYIRPVD